MKPARAKLIKLKTGDGIVEMGDNVLLGKIYLLDLDSIRAGIIFNTEKMKIWEGDVVKDLNTENEWLPLEMLQIIEEEQKCH